MNVRRYRARDMRDAMRQVREHQGSDAVILSSRRGDDGLLEVVASLDAAPEAGSSSFAQGLGESIPVDPQLAAMRREICDLRTLLMQQQALSESDQWAARHPLASQCIGRLMRSGFSEKLARSLTGGVQEDSSEEMAWSRLRSRLSASIATTSPTVLDQGGMLALVGSTGVGKTTTLNRLALRQIRRMGPDSVTLVTLDRQRIGAYKQLQAFGQMAGIPVMLLESERDLTALTNRATEGKLVLIDTQGQAARDAAERRLFAQVRNEVDLETWLVVAATHQSAVLRQVLQSFQVCDPAALVLTKVDEAEQLGETLSVLLEQRTGLVFYSDGQRLDEDFHKADTMYLTRLALQEPAYSVPPPQDRDAMLINSVSVGRVPATSQTQTLRDGMVLESIVPFRKALHAAY
ncbi:flagellar biosynthetic protein FlhF [Thiorhodococcus drewsii AZ1]|uniref:Flagellar biosynthesis protein FlhF n=1 Tax=Thiorhodococcus drewsii AZ1 TaxID=765913 RepID=G2E348_9GAMM|nr:FtsK/SpoIIIE domain-containing protein [Thiorhodococcus drewsii]EGV30510.1 flagellar biosynthetic protein FlhF [Thiorhodococcus drewsii AZ1]